MTDNHDVIYVCCHYLNFEEHKNNLFHVLKHILCLFKKILLCHIEANSCGDVTYFVFQKEIAKQIN